jgi:single-strand DNA-binding protein
MVNKAIILGNVGADPEVRVLDGGAKVARIRVATTERYTDNNNQKQERTEWHTISLWRGLADVVEKYVHKGSQVYVEGKFRTREYEQNGEKRYATEIVAEDMKLLGRPKDANETPAVAHTPRYSDELPY